MIGTREITGRTVLTGMLMFFGVIFAVNAAFVYFALDSWPGLSTENAYRKGLEYNKVLKAADSQAARGWQSTLSLAPRAADQNRFTLTMHDAGGAPLSGLRVAVDLRRPTHEGVDQRLQLRADGPGRYSADVRVPFAGLWHAVVTAHAVNNETYVMKHTVMVKE